MSFELKPSKRRPAQPVTDAERALRVDLAAAYRLVALQHWDDLIYTHISAAVPGEPGHFLINPFGLGFEEVCASNLVKINAQGEILSDTAYGVNVTGFALHAAVHAARPDAVCVMHLHNTPGIAVSIQQHGLLPISQHALRFHGCLAHHDYQGLALSPSEAADLTRSLGDKPAMLLRNHGTLTLGRTVAEAYVLMATLVKACEIQVQALSTAGGIVQPAPAVVALTAHQLFDGGAVEGALEWPVLLRRLDRIDPHYKD